MCTRVLFALAAAAGLTAAPARAEVKPHALFTEGMVLQRGMPAPVFGTANPGEEVAVTLDLGNAKLEGSAAADKDGRWVVKLPKLDDKLAGGPYTLNIQGKAGGKAVSLKNVLIGEVWVCSGQSNMEWTVRNSANPEEAIKSSANPSIRLFTVPKKLAVQPERDVNATWVECGPKTVPGFSAVGYFFGRDLQKALNVPVGLIHTSWGGTPAEGWTSAETLQADPTLKGIHDGFVKARESYPRALQDFKDAAAKAKEAGQTPPKPPVNPDTYNQNPTLLYNGMIAPLIPYGIKGAIWYQGESNANRAYQYRTLFPAMIADWRKNWGEGDFPFLFVQLAPFLKASPEPQEHNWAELREAQLMTLTKLPKTGQAVITDVGEADIHPKKKEPVGARLALAARGIAYGEKIEFSGPVYKSMTVEGDKAVLSFGHVGAGLEARDGALKGFAVAGDDHKFIWADAKIEGDKVVVSSPKVSKPVAVRYGWAVYPDVNLWNKDGLPATPFRTDDFPITTGPKQ